MSATEEARRQAALAEEAKRRGLQEWELEASKAVDDALVRSIVDDFRRGPAQPSSLGTTPDKPKVEPKAGSGWEDAAPLQQPPGIKIIDAMMDQQDKIDRAERIKKALEVAAMSQRSERMK